MIRLLCLLVLLIPACSGSDEERARQKRPEIPVITGQQVEHASAGEGGFDKAAFSCCETEAATRVMQAVIGLGEALSADDAARAAERVPILTQALSTAVSDPGTRPEARALLEQMSALSQRMAGQELEGIREEYLDLAEPVTAFARLSQGGSGRMALAFCPMKPGRWIQAAPEIANPYYGAQMLRCGVFEPLPEGG